MKSNHLFRELLPVLLLTTLGFLVMGYHPGTEDDAVYLTGIKADLNPALFPHDSDFFRLQLQASVFDGWMAHFVRVTGMPVTWAELLWQFLCLFLILWACFKIAELLFSEVIAQWAGVAMVAAMFTLPVSGTALFLVDQHLHPRTAATGLILIAIWRILSGKRWQAIPLLMLAFVIHPLMTAMAISFCCFLVFTTAKVTQASPLKADSFAAAVPLSWIFEPPTPVWRKALETRNYFFLYRWTWYEWLGALGPLFLFWWLWRFARKRGETLLARFALAAFAYGVFQQAIAMILLALPSLVRLTPFQPMRYLHLIYLFLALIGGCLIGKHLLKTSIWRWAVFLLIINGSMFAGQRALFPGSEHLELPGRPSANPWLQAFDWIRRNTPTDAYFALDPFYMQSPGEDYHSFRALAERSQLSDAVKDTTVVTQIPELGPVWDRQVEAQQGWPAFQIADFERLKKQFGVDWALVSYPQPSGLDCRWHNASLAVCQIP